MTPNVDERLASMVRALSEVILPHLPPEASLAQEQVQLCIGHLQILRTQIDDVPAFERAELDDALHLADALMQGLSGGEQTAQALARLADAARGSAQPASPEAVRTGRKTVLGAVDALVSAVMQDGGADARTFLSQTVLAHEAARTLKDRQWYAAFGFDTL